MSTSTSFLHSQIPLSKPLSTHRNKGFTKVVAIRRETQDDRNYNGRAVDENLIVLRKRIHEMKVMERNYEPPSEWMGWEKRFYANYDSIICEAMGFLQSQLMETRPSLALGFIALLALSLPTSTAVIMFHLIQIIKGIIHLS